MELNLFDTFFLKIKTDWAMTEATFCRYLVGKFRELGARVTRIENLVSSGAPDINLHVYGEERWFETKVCTHITGAHTSEVRPSQFAWHSAQITAGGNAFIVVYNKTTDTVALFESRDMVVINQGPWVSDQRGAKPKIVCKKTEFIKNFLNKYTIPREEINVSATGNDIRRRKHVETSGLSTDVAY